MSSTTLTQAFSDIANAIRAKGVTGTMTPLQMPTKVASITQSSKYGVPMDGLLGNVNGQGELQSPSTSFQFSSNDIVSIPSYRLYGKFMKATTLTSVSLPNVTTVGENGLQSAFYGCTSLTTVDLSKMETVGATGMQHVFIGCTSLETVYLSSLSTVGTNGLNNAFNGCVALEVVDFSEATAVPEITTSTFSNTNSTFQIVVPDSLYSTWIAATNWSARSSQIVKASEYTPAS